MKLGTHNGMFHADDVFACATLKLIYPEAEVVRTRDEYELTTCDIVFDVGGEYTPEFNVYDHHFKDKECYEDGLPYSSFGLIWKHFSSKLCSEEIASRIANRLVRPIDATDNGVRTMKRIEDEGTPNVGIYSISAIIIGFNPIDLREVDKLTESFNEAVALAQKIIGNMLASEEAALDFKDEVDKAVEEAGDKEYIILSRGGAWPEHLFANANSEHILYALFEDENYRWRIQAVPEKAFSFDMRKPLPEAWAGLRDEEFSAQTGISDGIFCHPAKFVCGVTSKESAINLVEQAIKA